MGNFEWALPTSPAGGFFDWASTSPIGAAAAAARREFARRQDLASDATLFTQQETALLEGLRDRLRRLVGAPQGWDVILGRSAAELFSAVASGVGTRRRTTVILAEPIHPAVSLAWFGAARRRGLTIVLIPSLPTGSIDVRTVRARISRDCLAVCTTHVSHSNGGVQPVDAVTAAAKEAGALALVDGAQAVGRVAVDVGVLNCDAYIGVGRKALLAPIGTAFLAARAGLLDDVEPSIWSTRSAALDERPSRAARPLGLPNRLEGALPDLSGLSALRGSADEFLTRDIAQFQVHVDALVNELRSRLASSGVNEPARAPGRNSGILTFAVSAHTARLQADLRRQGLVVAAGEGTIRVSVHAANDLANVTQLIEGITRYVAA